MEKYFFNASSWIWRNKGKFVFWGLLTLISYCIIGNYITLPWKIDFFINWKEYQYIAENIVFNYPEIRIIDAKEIVFFESKIIEWRVVRKKCRNTNLKTNSTVYSDIQVCDEKYSWLFHSIGNIDILYISVFDIDDSKEWQYWSKVRPSAHIQIFTNSFFSRILDTSYIYSKWFFKNPDNLWRNYPQILNEDWWVYQDPN